MSPAQIKNLRAKLEFTQAELAKALGLSRLTISQYEIGFRQPGTTVLILLRVLDSLSRVRAHELVALFRSHAGIATPKRKRGRREA